MSEAVRTTSLDGADEAWLRTIGAHRGVGPIDDGGTTQAAQSEDYHDLDDELSGDDSGADADRRHDDQNTVADIDAGGTAAGVVEGEQDWQPVDYDNENEGFEQGASSVQSREPRRRFSPRVLGAFGAAAALATVVTVSATLVNSPAPQPTAADTGSALPRPPQVPAEPQPPANNDKPLAFTASSDCLPGSTAAQSVADPNSPTPWICVRSVDGQVLEIDLGRMYLVSAVSIVPGAVTKAGAAGGSVDPWFDHRVVTRLQWQFNDDEHTVVNQNTGNERGERVQAIEPPVLTSKITAIIQETSRPPTAAPSTPLPAPGAGLIDATLGGEVQVTGAPAPAPILPSQQESRPDPSDRTFAVGGIKIIGRKPV